MITKPPTILVDASVALLAALEKLGEMPALSSEERYEIAVVRLLTARALWRSARVERIATT